MSNSWFIPLKKAADLCEIAPSMLRRWVEQDGIPLHRLPEGLCLLWVDLHKCLLRRGLAIPSGLMDIPKILIVEDDPDMLLTMVDSLEGMAERVNLATAADGQRGLRKFIEFRPDLLVTDIEMPGLSGIELCRWARQNKELFPTKILAITGHHSLQRHWAALDSGADEYLPKPFTPQQLREAASLLLRVSGFTGLPHVGAGR